MRSIYITFFVIFTALACDTVSKKVVIEQKLPYLGRHEYNKVRSNGKEVTDTVYHRIPDFSFTNQDSIAVNVQTVAGKIYVADFFFTSCPTICPVMKREMLRIYEAYKDNEQVAILSHSIDPEYDTVALLKDFAERIGVEDSKTWHFLTGEKEKIYEIAQKSYMVSATEDELEPGGFVHSGAFILVDKNRHIRGIYDGTKADQVDRLIKDMNVLLKEG